MNNLLHIPFISKLNTSKLCRHYTSYGHPVKNGLNITSIKWQKWLQSQHKNKQLSQYIDKAKHTAGFQGSGFFQKLSSVFFSLQFAMWWLWFLRGRKKSSCSAAQNEHLPPATSQTFCYNVNYVNVGYSFKATCIQYIWTPNTSSCILEHKWTHTSHTKGTVGHLHPAEFFFFVWFIKSNYFLMLLMLLLETLQ